MAKFTELFMTHRKFVGLAAATFQLPLETKERVDQIATTLNTSSAEVYRKLVEASLPDLEAEVEAHLEGKKRTRK